MALNYAPFESKTFYRTVTSITINIFDQLILLCVTTWHQSLAINKAIQLTWQLLTNTSLVTFYFENNWLLQTERHLDCLHTIEVLSFSSVCCSTSSGADRRFWASTFSNCLALNKIGGFFQVTFLTKWGAELSCRQIDHVQHSLLSSFQVKSKNHEICR